MKKTPRFCITKISKSIRVFRETPTLWRLYDTKHTNTLCEENAEFLNVKVGGTRRYDCALKG